MSTLCGNVTFQSTCWLFRTDLPIAHLCHPTQGIQKISAKYTYLKMSLRRLMHSIPALCNARVMESNVFRYFRCRLRKIVHNSISRVFRHGSFATLRGNSFAI